VVAVFGNMAQAALAQFGRIGGAGHMDRLALKQDPSGDGTADAGDRLEQL
jgi:hypothetical protein